MYKPEIKPPQRSEEIITDFCGLDRRLKAAENTFFDEKNISSQSFPAVSSRNKRGVFNIGGDGLHGLFGKDRLCFIKNGRLYYGDEAVTGLTFLGSEAKRSFVSMGSKLLVFPDKVYVNTLDVSDCGSLEAEFLAGDGVSVSFSMCRRGGEEEENIISSATPPESPENGTLWLDTSGEVYTLNVYSSDEEIWSEISETYVKISSPNIGAQFKKGDGIALSGIKEASLNGTFVVQSKTSDSLVIIGIIHAAFTQKGGVSVTRKLPDMDFVCENGNRLWGCSSKNNEIYASKLGDPENFNCFEGLSTDSYAVTVGTDGEFTAAVSYRGYALFFKENCLHKIYGGYPPFTVTSSYLRGVQKGSERSVALLNESLYYKSPTCICRYDGGVPVSISAPLGSEYYKDAVGEALGDIYSVCMSDRNNKRTLFSFDEQSGVWHKEDGVDVKEFAKCNCNLYFLAKKDGETKLYLSDGEVTYGNFANVLGGFSLEESVSWLLETGLWGTALPGNKYYSNIELRMSVKENTTVKISFSYDDSGVWEKETEFTAKKTGSYTVPCITRRCDCLKIRIEGKGSARLLSIARVYERGSNLNV